MAGPLVCGRPTRVPPDRCLLNLLGGSPRTTAPGCIRPPPSAAPCTERQREGTTALSSHVTGTGTSASAVLPRQHPAGWSSRGNIAQKETAESTTLTGYCPGEHSAWTTSPRCCANTSVEIRDGSSGFGTTVDVPSTSTSWQNSSEVGYNDRQPLPLYPTTSSHSRTLPDDVCGLQSFQVLSSKSPCGVDVVQKRSRRCVARFSGRVRRVSLWRHWRLFVDDANERRGRSTTRSSRSVHRPTSGSAAPADCGALPQKESSSSLTSADGTGVRSPIRRWLVRLRRRDFSRRLRDVADTRTREVESDTSVTSAEDRAKIGDSESDLSTTAAAARSNSTTDVGRLPRDVMGSRGTAVTTAKSPAGARTDLRKYTPEDDPQKASTRRPPRPPTSLDLRPVGRRLTTSAGGRRQVRCRVTSYESIGQCSVDVLASTDDAGQCTHNSHRPTDPTQFDGRVASRRRRAVWIR